MKTFYVKVGYTTLSYAEYYVEADSEIQAREMLEGSNSHDSGIIEPNDEIIQWYGLEPDKDNTYGHYFDWLGSEAYGYTHEEIVDIEEVEEISNE